MAPTQLLLIIPFVRLGEWLLRAPHRAISIKAAFAFAAHDTERAAVVLRDAYGCTPLWLGRSSRPSPFTSFTDY